MTRILLALLALLGFAVQAAPAEAALRDAGRAEIGAVQAVAAQGRIAAAAIKGRAPPVMRRQGWAQAYVPLAPAEPGFRARTVFLRIDRARD